MGKLFAGKKKGHRITQYEYQDDFFVNRKGKRKGIGGGALQQMGEGAVPHGGVNPIQVPPKKCSLSGKKEGRGASFSRK